MIVKTTKAINGKTYDWTYSDSGRYVVRDGASYEEAVDPLGSGREYVEGEPIPATDADPADVLAVLLGGADD